MKKRILLITGDGGESYETLYAWHRFLEAGHEARIAANAARRLHLVMHRFEPGWDTYVELPGYPVEAHLSFAEARAEDYDAVLILGGRAPEYLRHNPQVVGLVREFDRRGKWIFAICHGIQVLITAGVVSGARVTCYENVRYEVESNGGTFVNAQAVRDRNLVTAQTWESHPEFYREVFSCLEAREPETAVRAG